MNYKRIYDSIIERSKTRLVPEGYVERHHIIPSCIGGSNDKENIAVLTPEEHFLCHVLLVKIYPEDRGLIYAVNKMCRGHKGKRKRRKLYGWLKRKYSEQRKIDSVGNGNTQYGTMWINRVGTTENKKIGKDEPIPDGWRKGRKIQNNKSKCSICRRDIKYGAYYCKDHTYTELHSIKKEKTIQLFNEFVESECDTLSEFCDKYFEFSVVTLSKRFKKYIDGYHNLKMQGSKNLKEQCTDLQAQITDERRSSESRSGL